MAALGNLGGSPRGWSVDDVVVWLKLAKCGDVCERVRTHQVSGAALLQMARKGASIEQLTEGLSAEVQPRFAAAVAELSRVATCVEDGRNPFEVGGDGSAAADAAADGGAESGADGAEAGTGAAEKSAGLRGWLAFVVQWVGTVYIFMQLREWWEAREPILGPPTLMKNDDFGNSRH
jgi:hypothetical protein